jgi:hypothetical protein
LRCRLNEGLKYSLTQWTVRGQVEGQWAVRGQVQGQWMLGFCCCLIAMQLSPRAKVQSLLKATYFA